MNATARRGTSSGCWFKWLLVFSWELYRGRRGLIRARTAEDTRQAEEHEAVELKFVSIEAKLLPMTPQLLSERYITLPLEAQRQVDDFVEFLRQKYAPISASSTKELEEEPFIGMWRDRDDLQESTDQVRELRRLEWGGNS